MKQKKIVTGFIGATMMGGLLVSGGQLANAAETTYSGTSDASVSFKAGSIVTPPTDPSIKPPVTPVSGSFGLLYVPKEFNFAETNVPASTVTETTSIAIDVSLEGSPAATGTTGSNPTTKHAAVGDVRGTRANGWKLEAKLADELQVSPTKKLTGATIKMSQGLNTLDPTTWTKTATTPGDGVHSPNNVLSTVTISTTATTVASAAGETTTGAADGRGEGYWDMEYTNISLEVPAGAMNAVTAGEKYTGTVNWTLTDAI